MDQGASLRGIRVIALDAMGVIYRAADDVEELLVPFVAEHGGADAPAVRAAYLLASRGALTAAELWRRVGLDPALEDAYLTRHALAPGVPAFLEWARAGGYRLACLSNDVGEWSLKLRRRFELERCVGDWVISAEVGARKPEPRMYEALLSRVAAAPDEVLLVDDRVLNVEAAPALGIRAVTLQASPDGGAPGTVRSLREVAERPGAA